MYLVMLNGPCGVGKSETAMRLETRQPEMIKWIRLDDVRKTIPEERFMKDGQPDAMARMWHANVVGRELAKASLESGQSVVVDAIKYQPEWVRPWVQFGNDSNATVLDVCLQATKDVVLQRAAARGYKPTGRLTPEKVANLYDKVAEFCVERPETIIIPTDTLSLEETTDAVMALMPQLVAMSLSNA